VDVRILSCLERTASWLDELIQHSRRLSSLYTENPKLVADVTRKAKALRTSLNNLQDFLNQPKH